MVVNSAGSVSRTNRVNSFSTVGIGIRCGTTSCPKCPRKTERCGRSSVGERGFDRNTVCRHPRLTCEAQKRSTVDRFWKTCARRAGRSSGAGGGGGGGGGGDSRVGLSIIVPPFCVLCKKRGGDAREGGRFGIVFVFCVLKRGGGEEWIDQE